MAYQFHYLSEQLILVIWERYPTPREERQFLSEHQKQLQNATNPLYYISDLRRGKILTVSIINEMSKLTKHKNYGGGTAFSTDPISKIMVGSFRKLTREASERTQIFDTPEEALKFLESMEHGITENIDWEAYME